MHWDHGHVQPPDHGFQPALERKQVSGPADGTFGENAEHLAARQFGAGPLDGLPGAVRLGPDGDGLASRKPQVSSL